MRLPRETIRLDDYPKFHLDTEKYYPEATLFLITGEDLDALLCYLCSDVGFFVFTKCFAGPQFDATGFRYKKEYISCLPVPHSDTSFSIMGYNEWVKQKLNLTSDEVEYVHTYKKNLVNQRGQG